MKPHFAGLRYGDLKKQAADAVVAGIEPIQKNYAELTAERGYLRRCSTIARRASCRSPTRPSNW